MPVRTYADRVKQIQEDHLQLIRGFYRGWEYTAAIHLKFRQLKAYVFDTNKNHGRWVTIQHHVNRRRIVEGQLGDAIRQLIADGLFPIRVFHSIAEWHNPERIDLKKDTTDLMLKANIFFLENDDSLEVSLQAANAVQPLLQGDRLCIFSGNKSMQVWYLNFELEDWLVSPEKERAWHPWAHEALDRKARKIFFRKIQADLTWEMDRRAATDSRRIIPIIGTLNGFTGRTVTSFPCESLCDLQADDIRAQTGLDGWQAIKFE